jgi:SPP1 gp7 family putative phage head morphogenesis protein
VTINPRITQAILANAAKRVTEINDWTRDGIRDLIAQGAKDGLSPAELGDVIQAWTGFDEYRAERIATTELRSAYNEAALGSYREAGLDMVEAIDGDGDEECAARNGQTFSLDEAAGEDDLEHPNGTLDWLPVISEEAALGDLEEEGKAKPMGRASKAAKILAELAAADDESDERTRDMIGSLTASLRADGKAKDAGMRDLASAVMALAQRENPAPVIHVAAPQITVQPTVIPAPIVKMPARKPVTRKVTRDSLGRIESVTEE